MTKNWEKTAVVTVLGTVIAAVFTVCFAGKQADASAARQQAVESQPGSEQRALSQALAFAQAGRESMSYIVAARRLIESKNTAEAKKYLDGAKKFLVALEDTFSQKNSTQKKQAGAIILPLYSRVGLTAETELTEAMKEKLNKLAPYAVQGRHDKVIDGLRGTGLDMVYSYVDMPVQSTLSRVDLALQALAKNDPAGAGRALAAAEDGLVRETVTIGTKKNTVS